MLDLENATKLEVKKNGVWEPIQAGQVEAGDVLRMLDPEGRLILQGRAHANFHTGLAEMLDPYRSDE